MSKCVFLRALPKQRVAHEYLPNRKTLGGVHINRVGVCFRSFNQKAFWHYKPSQLENGGDERQNVFFKSSPKTKDCS